MDEFGPEPREIIAGLKRSAATQEACLTPNDSALKKQLARDRRRLLRVAQKYFGDEIDTRSIRERYKESLEAATKVQEIPLEVSTSQTRRQVKVAVARVSVWEDIMHASGQDPYRIRYAQPQQRRGRREG